MISFSFLTRNGHVTGSTSHVCNVKKWRALTHNGNISKSHIKMEENTWKQEEYQEHIRFIITLWIQFGTKQSYELTSALTLSLAL